MRTEDRRDGGRSWPGSTNNGPMALSIPTRSAAANARRALPIGKPLQPAQIVTGIVLGDRHPVVQPDVGRLVAIGLGASAEESLRRCEHQQVRGCLATRVDDNAVLGQRLDDPGAFHRSVGQHARQRGQRTLAQLVVQAELAAPAGVPVGVARAENAEQPTDVVAVHHVQRAAHQPGAHGARVPAGRVHVGGEEPA
jgi:hypothetical protein